MRCDQATVLRCEKVCGKDLSCGQHKCQVVCHKGECPPCQVTLVQGEKAPSPKLVSYWCFNALSTSMVISRRTKPKVNVMFAS